MLKNEVSLQNLYLCQQKSHNKNWGTQSINYSQHSPQNRVRGNKCGKCLNTSVYPADTWLYSRTAEFIHRDVQTPLCDAHTFTLGLRRCSWDMDCMCVTSPDLECSCITVCLWLALWSSYASPAIFCTFLNYILNHGKEHEVLQAKGKNYIT